MLTSKQIRMLQLLDNNVDKCNQCGLKRNGTLIPDWTEQSKYVIIGESPGSSEIRFKRHFASNGGKILTKLMYEEGFNSRDFLIINTVQCKTTAHTNSKPNEMQIESCQSHLRKYLKVLKPEKILCLGNYAKSIFTGDIQGVLRQRGEFRECVLDGYTFNVLFTIHPAYCIYNADEGVDMLRRDIVLFKNSNFQRNFDDWMFTEDDFLL